MKTNKYCQYLCSSIFYITLLFLALFLLFLVAYWHEIVQPQKIILTEHRGEEVHDFPESNKCQNLEKTSCKTDVWSVSVDVNPFHAMEVRLQEVPRYQPYKSILSKTLIFFNNLMPSISRPENQSFGFFYLSQYLNRKSHGGASLGLNATL